MVGEIAIVIPVVGSVHEEEEVVVDVVEVVVVHVMAVLAGAAWWQETRANTLTNMAKIGRRLTTPLPLTFHMPIYCGSVSTLLQKCANLRQWVNYVYELNKKLPAHKAGGSP